MLRGAIERFHVRVWFMLMGALMTKGERDDLARQLTTLGYDVGWTADPEQRADALWMHTQPLA